MDGSKSHSSVKSEEENEVTGEAVQCLYNKRQELLFSEGTSAWLQVNTQAKDSSHHSSIPIH